MAENNSTTKAVITPQHNVHLMLTLPVNGSPSLEFFVTFEGYMKFSQFVEDNPQDFVLVEQADEKGEDL